MQTDHSDIEAGPAASTALPPLPSTASASQTIRRPNDLPPLPTTPTMLHTPSPSQTRPKPSLTCKSRITTPAGGGSTSAICNPSGNCSRSISSILENLLEAAQREGYDTHTTEGKHYFILRMMQKFGVVLASCFATTCRPTIRPSDGFTTCGTSGSRPSCLLTLQNKPTLTRTSTRI